MDNKYSKYSKYNERSEERRQFVVDMIRAASEICKATKDSLRSTIEKKHESSSLLEALLSDAERAAYRAAATEDEYIPQSESNNSKPGV